MIICMYVYVCIYIYIYIHTCLSLSLYIYIMHKYIRPAHELSAAWREEGPSRGRTRASEQGGSAPKGVWHSTIFFDPRCKFCLSNAHLCSGSLMV